MFDLRAITELKKVVGFRDHWNATDIPVLPVTLSDSESGQYYQDFHPMVRLDYISALLPSDYPLDTFLDDIETSAIKQMLNKMQTFKKLNNSGQDLARNNLIYDNVLKNKPIINESRFVGVEFALNDTSVGIRAIINRVGLYLTTAQPSLTLYLFNSLQEDAVNTYTFTSVNANSFTWLETQINIDYQDSSGTDGGVWWLGYYQNDLVGQAISYDVLNWRNGYCQKCDGGTRSSKFNSISKYVNMSPFYVSGSSLPAVGKLFDADDIVYNYTCNFGMNFNVSVVCNLSQFWVDNRLSMVNAIGKTVALKILEMMKASSQISAIEQNVQFNIIRDLEGDRETQSVPFWQQAERSIKSTNFDQSNINSTCVPCARKGAIYGAV